MILKHIAILFSVLIFSCNSMKDNKNTVNNTISSEEVIAQEKKMMDEGFKKGVIVFSEVEDDCPYTIKMQGETANYLDPINLDESFKKDGEKIWFKYNGLGRMNRCVKANPINIAAMQKRAE